MRLKKNPNKKKKNRRKTAFEWLKSSSNQEGWAKGKKLTQNLQRTRANKTQTQSVEDVGLTFKVGIKFHWPSYQYMRPGTHLKKRLKQGDSGIKRLDKQHDIDYSHAKTSGKQIQRRSRPWTDCLGVEPWQEGFLRESCKQVFARKKMFNVHFCFINMWYTVRKTLKISGTIGS